MEDKNKELQLKEEAAEKVSGGWFELALHSAVGPDSYESEEVLAQDKLAKSTRMPVEDVL